MNDDHNQHQKPVKSYCGGKPNYVEIGEIVQAFGDLTAVEIPNMPPAGTKLYVASDDMSEKRVQTLTENDILDTRFAKRFVDDAYAILSQKDLVAFVRELEAKWIKNETP